MRHTGSGAFFAKSPLRAAVGLFLAVFLFLIPPAGILTPFERRLMKPVALLACCLVLALSGVVTDAGAQTTCTACGGAITSDYFETGGGIYHPEHFTCAHCRQPIKEAFSSYRNQNYHSWCFEQHVALRCSVCSGVVQGKHIIDFWGNASHIEHQNEVPTCSFCGRFVVGDVKYGAKELRDGRNLCGICAPTSVASLGEAKALLRQSAQMLDNFGIRVVDVSIDLYLADRDQLKDISGGRQHATGFTDFWVKKNFFGKVLSREIRIYVLRGMPRTEMIATLAHELTHVWQFLNGPLDQDAAVSEGSCNFASYLVLRKMGGEEADFIIDGMLSDEDPVYGVGFRQVKMYAESRGTQAWLEQLQKKNPKITGL